MQTISQKKVNKVRFFLQNKKRHQMVAFFVYALFYCFSDCNGNSNGHTNHRVVTGAQKAHHLNVSRNRRRTCKLSIRVHTTHGIGHTVGSGACSYVIGMQGTPGKSIVEHIIL